MKACLTAPAANEPASSGVVHSRIKSPTQLRSAIPLSEQAAGNVAQRRAEISAILSGQDQDRLLLVCGPCSIDDVNAAMEYAERLERLARQVEDRAVVVMRSYFEKPRSVVGWKGLLYDPLQGESGDPERGLELARRLLVQLCENGIACATEFLNPQLAPYIEDCVAYGSIGSRTVESQVHRELASRLPLPIGMKNGMDGALDSAVNGMRSARAPHSFFGQDVHGAPCLVETQGNATAHLILRGGKSGPNFDASFVNEAVERGRELGLRRPVLVDCSHGNSRKDHRRQAGVAAEVVRQFREGQSGIAGIMLESYLVEGRQGAEEGGSKVFGQSITDACIGWKDTESIALGLI